MLVNPLRQAPPQSGMTLIELGLVIGVFGFIMLFVASFFTTGILATQNTPQDERRVTVRDVDMIFEAARQYHAQYDNWPRNSEGQIHISGLSPDFLDLDKVQSVYSGCGARSDSSCTPYTLKGWDRSMKAETTDPGKADDLILEFGFPGGTFSDAKQENNSDPATVLASLLPMGILKGGASGSNETLIESRIHRPWSRSYLLLDGEYRVVTYNDGDFREVSLLTYNNENLADSWQVTGPAISLMPVGDRGNPSTEAAALERINAGELPEDEFFIGANEVSGAPTSYLRMQRFDAPCRPDNPCSRPSSPSNRARAVFGIRGSSGFHHQMMWDSPFQGSLSLWLLPNASPSRTHGRRSPLQITLVPADDTANVEAHWDVLLSNDSNHRSLQTRLCALERQYVSANDVSVDCACPGETRSCR